jgi:hypothetical protein
LGNKDKATKELSQTTINNETDKSITKDDEDTKRNNNDSTL